MRFINTYLVPNNRLAVKVRRKGIRKCLCRDRRKH